jgi:hypothetical protein
VSEVKGEMGMERLLVTVASAALLVGAAASGAFAGEVNGSKNGKGDPPSWSTPAPLNARSACVYSGLEDNEANGAEQGLHGVTQNWGHTKDAGVVVDSPDNHGAAQVWIDLGGGAFLWGCNPHVGAED